MKKFLIACLLLCASCACGDPEEKPQRISEGDTQSRYQRGDKKIDIEFSRKPTVILFPSELDFYCAGPVYECVGPLEIIVRNETSAVVTIQRPAIEGSSAFYFPNLGEYPVFLEPYGVYEIEVDFRWTSYQQFATLTIETSEKTLVCRLSGKWFIP